MASATFEPRNSSRRPRARSRSLPRAEGSRRSRRSRSPPQGFESPPDRPEGRMRDNTRRVRHDRPEVFQSGTGSRGRVCAVCLGRHEHAFAKCDATKLWDGSATAARKTEQGRLVTTNSLPLCFDWQIRGCGSASHPERHMCSGCGKANHGAQGCPRAEKK